MLRNLIFFISILLCSSFIVEIGVGPDDYVQYYKQNKSLFVKSSEGKDVLYTARIMPSSIRAIQAYQIGQINEEEAKMLISSDRLEVLLEIQIRSNEKSTFLKAQIDTLDFDNRLNYYAFEFNEDLTVKVDGKVVPIYDFHFERDFGLSHKASFTFSLPLTARAKNLSLEINNRIIKESIIPLHFDLLHLKKLPRLKKIKKWKNV